MSPSDGPTPRADGRDFQDEGAGAPIDRPTIAFVIPTKDRPAELRTMLRSLAAQEAQPVQVIVVDSSEVVSDGYTREFSTLPIAHVPYPGRPSAAGQRNAGAALVCPDVDLVCFFDDDQILLPGALQSMLAFWAHADEDVAGAGFNFVNEVDRRTSFFKRSRLTERLGLYCQEPGVVARSGWQTLVGIPTTDLHVEWLGTGAAVWKRGVLDRHAFDEFFEGYSYLEDLDFSYGVSREAGLVLVAAACVHHYPSKLARISQYEFGKIEVHNRLYFVRKYGLSIGRCRAALVIRLLMSLGQGAVMPWKGGLARAWGNLAGFLDRSAIGTAS